MLEAGAVLRTWRLAHPPEPGRSTAATPLGEHRRLYLDYEGPVSGNRGRVIRWDAGVFTWQVDEADHVAVHLDGGRLRGVATLRQNAEGAWIFTFQ
jgi:hypothetical protein